MIQTYSAWNKVDLVEWRNRWPNFSPAELACPHCQALVVNPYALDRLQAARSRFGRPVDIASAYRCPLHPIELNKLKPGPHSRGGAFDAYPRDKPHTWIKLLWREEPMGFGMGNRDGKLHLHVDWDELLGERVWGY